MNEQKQVWDPGASETFLVRLRIALARRKLLSLQKNQRQCIIDAGCGRNASFLRSVRNEFTHLIGIDFDVDAPSLERVGIQTRKSDILSELKKIESNTADVISFLSIMEHVTDHEAILAECHRVLRKGGIIFINSPSWFGKFILENIVLRFFDKKRAYAAQVDTHTTYFFGWQMWQVIKNSGFISSEIDIFYSNFFCSVSACITKRERERELNWHAASSLHDHRHISCHPRSNYLHPMSQTAVFFFDTCEADGGNQQCGIWVYSKQ